VVGVYFQGRLEYTFDNVKIIVSWHYYSTEATDVKKKNVADLNKICTFNRTKVYEIYAANNIWT